MLRITLHDAPGARTFQLEGKLIGPWVSEAKACWQSMIAGPGESIVRLDLTGLTGIDAAGKAFLAEAHKQGAVLVASGCLMRAIVASLVGAPSPDCGCP